MRIRPLLVAPLLVVLGALPGASPAPAAAATSACPPGTSPSYPPGSCRLEVTPLTVAVGATVQVTGCGYGRGTKVKLTLVPTGQGTSFTLTPLLADTVGCIKGKVGLSVTATVGGTITFPAPGTYLMKGTGQDPAADAYELVSDAMTLTAATTSIDPSLAANRGSDRSGSSAAALAAAAGLGTVGAVVAVRRRRRTAARRPGP